MSAWSRRHVEWQEVTQFLLDHVANHSLRLRAEHVQRIGFVGLVGAALRTIAVGITNSFLAWIAANDAAAICTLAR
jgi:hypothetical protein